MHKAALQDFILSILPVPSQTLAYVMEHFEERTFIKNEFLLQEGKITTVKTTLN